MVWISNTNTNGSWLSSTLGYISGTNDSAFEKLVPVRIQIRPIVKMTASAEF